MRLCSIDGCGLKHDAKGYCHQHYKRWKLHGDPLVVKRAPSGVGYIGKKGHLHISINNKDTTVHRVIAEKAFGKPLPKGAQIHHADGNPLNNEPSNLVICPNAGYHRILHMRMMAYEACGNPNWMRCTFCKTYDDPINMRKEKSGRCVHVECSRKARQQRKEIP